MAKSTSTRAARPTPMPATWPGSKVESRSVAKLIPYSRNARTHTPAQIAKIAASINQWGWTSPILIDESDNVIAGHGRLQAAQSLGIEAVPVIVARGWTVAQRQAYVIADNQLALDAGWDREMLAAEMASLKELNFELGLIGFDSLELKSLLDRVQTQPVDENIPPPPTNPVTRAGDLWIMDGHRLLCGSSSSAEDVVRLVGDTKPRLVVTSPPYNVGMKYKKYDDRLARDEYLKFCSAVARCWTAVLEDGGHVVWNIGVSPKTWPLDHGPMLADVGLQFQRMISWVKSGVAYPIWQFTIDARKAGKYTPNYKHELILIFSKGEPLIRGRSDPDDRFSADVWEIHQSQATADLPGVTGGKDEQNSKHGSHKDAVHPAPFPVAIAEGPIRHLSAMGDVVADPFGGSGSTMIAAETMGRRCVSMDIDASYVDVAVMRWQAHTGKHAVLDGDGRAFMAVAEARMGKRKRKTSAGSA